MAAASFLASIDDPVIQESTSKAGAEIGWKYVKAAYEEISSSWSSTNTELYNVDEAHTLVYLYSLPIQHKLTKLDSPRIDPSRGSEITGIVWRKLI